MLHTNSEKTTQEAESPYKVIETLADVFARHNNKLIAVQRETGITYPTLAKHRDLGTLDSFLFVRRPDGSIMQYLPKQGSPKAKEIASKLSEEYQP